MKPPQGKTQRAIFDILSSQPYETAERLAMAVYGCNGPSEITAICVAISHMRKSGYPIGRGPRYSMEKVV